MPVFDYKCADCGSTYDVYHKRVEVKEDVVCPKCGSLEHKRLISASMVSMGGSSSADFSSSCGTNAAGSCCGGSCSSN